MWQTDSKAKVCGLMYNSTIYLPPCVQTLCLTVCPPTTVYDDLSHPPATYLYSYRTADGSYNNICDPKMGKADEPYARSVQQTHALQRNILPDAGLVFDTLLKCEKVQASGHLRLSSTVDGYSFSSSRIRPDFPASCFHSRHLSSMRMLHFVFSSMSTCADRPLEKRFPDISHGREHHRDIFVCRPGATIWQQQRDFEQDSCA